MPIETRRAARGALGAVLAPFLLLLLASVPLAVHHKNTEYLVAAQLGRSGLPVFDQAVLATLVQKVSDFDPAASASSGRRGLLLLDVPTARRHGLAIAEGSSAPARTIFRRLLAPEPREAAIVADERLDVVPHLRAAIAHYREAPRSMPTGLGPAIAALQSLVLSPRQAELLDRLLLDSRLLARLEGKAPLAQLEELIAAVPAALPSVDPALRGRLENQLAAFRHQVELFSRALPLMQARSGPKAVEYANSVKDVLAQVLRLEKWALHFLLGGSLFLVGLAVSILAGMSPRAAAPWAAAVVLALALAVELVDWRDAVLNGKRATLVGSLMDVVVTCVIPALGIVWYRVAAGKAGAPQSSGP